MGYVNSDQTMSLQCTQAIKRLVRVTSIWQNSASRIFFPAVARKILGAYIG